MDESKKKRRPPATTIEGRENQMIALAVDLAEQQLRSGKASSQVITHYLKLASTKHKLELEKIKLENALTKEKTMSIKEGRDVESLYAEALEAFKSYKRGLYE